MPRMDIRRAQGVHVEVVLGDAIDGCGLGRVRQAYSRQAGEESEEDGGAEFHHGSVVQDWVVTGVQVVTGLQDWYVEQVFWATAAYPHALWFPPLHHPTAPSFNVADALPGQLNS
ncbi:hypothetical protein RU820_05235 [Acidithiobacillus ferrooxidans]|uniref:hypothetical protein n=1 Tax=Acidithiobacillus ferrooxidans TaxID=920 RepID=UPI003C2C512D